MRKSIIAVVTLFAVTVQAPQPARGDAFATEITQLLNHAQLIMQYLRQAEQLAEAVKQTTDMLKNSKILPGQVFGPISSDLNALASIVQGGQALSYSLANLDSLFKARFPDTATRAQATSRSIEAGPKRPWTQRSEHCEPPDCKASNFRVSRRFSTRCDPWLHRPMGGCQPSR